LYQFLADEAETVFVLIGTYDCLVFTVRCVLRVHFPAAIIWWLEQEKPYTPRQIATYCYRMMCSLLKDIHAWDSNS
jgi:hypothetical protein